MRYEIESDYGSKIFDIEKREKGYWIRSTSENGETKEHVIEATQLDKVLNILMDGKSFDVGMVDHKDYVEVEVVGERHLINVYDPRKKSLTMMDADGGGLIQTQMPGRVIEVCVQEGDVVSKGQIMVIVEAMKMENPLKATKDGVVSEIYVENGDLVEAKAKLLLIDTE